MSYIVIAFDVECTKLPRSYPWIEGAYLVSASIAREDGTVRSWLFNHPEARQSQKQSIDELREELYAAKRIVAHNAKFDLLWLLQYGIDINPLKIFCTQVAEYLLCGQRCDKGSLTLGELSKKYGITDKIDKVKIFWESGYETDEIPASILLPYGEQDCINALTLYQRQSDEIVRQNLTALCTLQMELSKVLATIEFNGMLVDRHLVSKYGEDYGNQIRDIDGRILEILSTSGIDKESFNINSKEQLSAALYGGYIRQEGTEVVEKPRKDGSIRTYVRKCVRDIRIPGLGFRPIDKSETAKEGIYSTDLETLKSLKCSTPEQKQLIEMLTEKSRLNKMYSTYVEGLYKRLGNDDIAHFNFNQTVTRTGRLSGNSQQFPRSGTSDGIKKFFISRH